MKNRNSRMREIAFHTLFCMVSMVSILLTMQKKYTSENDPLQAQITMREFQFFESIIEKIISKDFFYPLFVSCNSERLRQCPSYSNACGLAQSTKCINASH
jgi:hypothetical protein